MRKLILAVVVVILCGAFVFGQQALAPALPAKIDRAALTERIAVLQNEQEQLKAQYNACGGAIQDCQYWLSIVEENEKGEVK